MSCLGRIRRIGFINPRYRIMEIDDKNYLVDFSNPRKLSSYMAGYGMYESVYHCWELSKDEIKELRYKERPNDPINILGYELDLEDESCELIKNDQTKKDGLDRYWLLAVVFAPVLSSISIIALSGILRNIILSMVIISVALVFIKLIRTPTIEISKFNSVRIRHYEKKITGKTSNRVISVVVQFCFLVYLWILLFREFNLIMFLISSFALILFTFGKFLLEPPRDHHFILEE